MSLTEQLRALPLEQRVNKYHEFLSRSDLDHYQILELSRTATSREIETAFHIYTGLFPQDQVSNIRSEDMRRKADLILGRLRRAYDVLNDFTKRAEYEKRGFREAGEGDEQKDDPIERAKVFYRKAQTLQQQREFHKAIMALKESIRLDPKTPSYYFLMGICQAEVSTMIVDAEKNLQKAAEMEEWNAEPLVALGMLFYRARLTKRAEVYFRKALALESGHPVARKKLEEIAGPDKSSFLAPLRDGLAKVLPSFFGKKKK